MKPDRTQEKARIVEMVRGGIPIIHAARVCKVTRQAVHLWRQSDKDFDADLHAAQSECIRQSVSVIQSQDDWRAHAWYLERRARQHFGKDAADAHAPVPEDERDVDDDDESVTTEDAERVLAGG